MALINCPECNNEVSDKAEVCVYCGFGVAKYVERQKKIIKIQEEAEKEAYLYVKGKKKEEKEKAEQEKREEEDRKNRVYNEAISKFASEVSGDVKKAEDLFSSILGWRDTDTYLYKCKNRIDKLIEQEKVQAEKSKKRKRKITIALIISIICVGIVIGGNSFYKKIIIPQSIYQEATYNIEYGDYEEAIEKLETITGYRDAMEQIEIALGKIADERYSEAEKLMEEEKYSEASEILYQIKDRRDVDNLLKACEDAMNYKEGIILLEEKKYKEALDLFLDNDFDFAGEKMKECYMGLAYQELSKNEYANALEYFTLADYQGEDYQKICYKMGTDAYEALDYVSAINYFHNITGYKDSDELKQKAKEAIIQMVKFDEETRNLLNGYWYKPKEDTSGGRIVAIEISDQSRKIWTGWDYNYTPEYVKRSLNFFGDQLERCSNNLVNNGDGTYSFLSKNNEGNEIRFLTFKVSGDSLEIISVFYPKWNSEVGIYHRVI